MNPEKIGRYEIKGELGRGGMATVYRAYDPRFEREVALKVLPREMLHDSQFRVRFEREAKTVAMLEHQAIVPVYDVGEEDGQPYFVMRYMTGGSLSERIKRGPIDLYETTRIISRIASALDEAHAKKVIHRDLKPGNILFDNHNAPYISDFGIAKFTAAQTNVTGSAIIGTPAYISPEQAQGEQIDGRSDIYALGIILFEMLSGRPPYDADTPMAVVVKHITEPVPHILDWNSKLPAGVEMVIEKAMAKNRDERFSTAGEMAEALEAVARGETPDLTNRTMAGAAAAAAAGASAGPSAGTMAGATRIAAPPRAGERPTVAPTPTAEPEKRPRRFSYTLIILVGGCLLLALLAGGGYFATRGNGFAIPPFGAPSATPTSPPPSPTATLEPPTETPTLEPTIAATEAPVVVGSPTVEVTAGPTLPVIGGSDMLAMLRNNDIYAMPVNGDGSQMVTLTNDGSVKTDLQFLPDHKTLLYLIDTTVQTVDLNPPYAINVITSFNNASYLDAFRVSPDGTQVAISMDRELYVVPFDVQALSKVHTKSDLLNLIKSKGCLFYNAAAIKDVRWSDDGKKLATEFLAPEGGIFVDAIRVMDISKCSSAPPARVGREFTATDLGLKDKIPSWDWDGNSLFLLNSDIRNDGFGKLILYNMDTNRTQEVRPVGTCCYRDSTWSADGNYAALAFQDINAGSAGPIAIYYVPYTIFRGGGKADPFTLPEPFYTDTRDKPGLALRAAPP